MNTLFISDLHLEDKRPEATELLGSFLRGPATLADAIYVLGDLFEFWIGDDVLTETAIQVAQHFSQLTDMGVPCYFMHGNRDFLLGSEYADKANFQLLADTVVIDLYGTPTLLLHGDTLCTDDVAYQQFRQQVRDPEFQSGFLKMPLQARLEMAQNARDASKRHTGTSSIDIMDVNPQAVCDVFQQHQVKHMIHGHTHRPANHHHDLPDGSSGNRIVLSDWYSNGSYLRVDPDNREQVHLTP
jgi:UDP-2,3-diacylglucosamine hydrolase